MLTEQGRAMRAKAERVPPAIGAAMGLKPAEFAALKRMLRQLAHNVSTSELTH